MAAMSCLPDLKVATLPDAAPDGPPTGPTSVPGFCGNGVIDFEGGEQCDPADAVVPGCSPKCSVTCENGFLDDASDHCYFASAAVTKFDDGELACENAGGHIFTFASEAEFQRVSAWRDGGAFWVGLEFDVVGLAYKPPSTVNEPGWSPKCDGCFAHTDAAVDFPALRDSGAGKKTFCVVSLAVNLSWYTVQCDVVLPGYAVPVVCEREPAGTTAHSCVGPATCLTVRFTVGKSRYVYFSTPAASAKDAADACTNLGGSLVVFETREEREQVARELAQYLPTAPTPKFWIGLSRSNVGWIWADGTPAGTYPLEWADNQPKAGNAASISLNQTSYDRQLAQAEEAVMALPYLCELGAP